MSQPISPGSPAPLGASCHPDGVNFSIHSPDALGLDLLLFAGPEDPAPSRTLSLDATIHRTGGIWHVFVPGLGHGQVYGWRARGPRQPQQARLFDPDKVLLDPYARAICGQGIYRRSAARARGDNTAHALRSVVVDTDRYDWEGDTPLPPPAGREIIYEMHLAGFTASPSSGLDEGLHGTYAGCIQKIPYLQKLGVTAVELLPIQQFETQDSPPGLQNYWGYSTLGYFAPHAQYSSRPEPTACVDEFRDLVKALHRAGLRVILDVVYNHTAEGGTDGPTLSFRGLDNPGYYLHDAETGQYRDYTGCGNTLHANGGVARRLITDSLRYWVRAMHVDGFRFDLGSALTRGSDGAPLSRPPLMDDIESDPLLAGTTLIAEAWDTGGLYQVGSFPGHRFAEWNGAFKETVRAFWRGDEGTIEGLMARITGSRDLYAGPSERPSHSINYVACHDGFSLADLVSYAEKHNEANGEENRDGSNHNLSSNHGVEGPTTDPAIQALRARQIRNFLTVLFFSHGTPMLAMGDEIGHTRQGNNNPWNQANPLNWLDWTQVDAAAEPRKFVEALIRFTAERRILREDRFWRATDPEALGDISWHGRQPGAPDWSPASHILAWTLHDPDGQEQIHVLLNASDEPQEFTLPPQPKGWARGWVVDTAAITGRDIDPEGRPEPDMPATRTLPSRSAYVVWDRWISSI